MKHGDQNKVLSNAILLYGMVMAKILLPLIVLPYLTRVLTKDGYGVVAYVKSLMMYAQILVDFGFLLSATKDISLAVGDRRRINQILGDVLVARLALCGFAFLGTVFAILAIPLLRPFAVFTLLSLIPVFLTVFLFDYLFRGIEKMGIITTRFVVMRTIAVVLTFVFVRSDDDLLMIPILDSIGSLFAVALVWHSLRKDGYALKFTGLRSALGKLKESAAYFVSNMATTAFGALNTLVIGIVLDAPSVAEWSLCFQCVTAVQQLYSPITDSIYPHMIKNRDAQFAKKIFIGFLVLVVFGCVLTYCSADWVILVIGGRQYAESGTLLRAFIPLLFFSFPAMFFGWPMLGAIRKVKEVTVTTVATGILQVMGLGALFFGNAFSVLTLAFLRGGTELFLFSHRAWYCWKWRNLFSQSQRVEV